MIDEDSVVRLLDEIGKGVGKGDREAAHVRADDLLLTMLLVAGYERTVKAYKDAHQRVGFCYA